MNLTTIQTVQPAKYHLDKLDLGKLELEEKSPHVYTFIEYMMAQKRVGFNMGADMFYACKTHFVVDYRRRRIIQRGKPFDETDWIEVSSEDLHIAMESVFEGQYSPTGMDTIIRLQMSGIRVYLTGKPQNLPKKPISYMRKIRNQLKSYLSSVH